LKIPSKYYDYSISILTISSLPIKLDSFSA
jgi:hypothetical protein